MGRPRKTEAEFWATFSPEPNTGCWIWTGTVDGDGYGRVRWANARKVAHRLAHELSRGPIPDGRFVCHSCDNGHLGCGNPDHLWLGTAKQNIHDALRKGRMAVGDRSPRRRHPGSYQKKGDPLRKLTAEQVREIRASSGSGERQASVAARYGVHPSAIYRVRHRRGYAGVA
jgi:hypothetical protein